MIRQIPSTLTSPFCEEDVRPSARARYREESRPIVDGSEQPVRRVRTAVLLILTCVAAVSVPWYPAFGLSFAWPTLTPYAFMVGGVFLLFFQLARRPRTTADLAIADTVLVTALLLLATNLGSPAQYLAVVLRQPLVDPWLAAADAAIGIHVGELAEWTRAQPTLALVLSVAYFSLLPQFLGGVLILGLYYKDRQKLWEYCFHFNFCLLLTLLGLALFPAACAFQYFGFESVLPQDRFIAHFNGLRDGSLTMIRFDDLEGLISMPSFHTAGGLMITWAFRRYWLPLAIVAPLNLLMILATFMTGAHYFVDVLATIIVFAVSVATHRAIVKGR